MSDIINQNTEPLFIFDMPDDETLSETISVKGEKGAKGDPTKLSQLENDTGFITKDAPNLTNYYNKTETDAKFGGKLDKSTFNALEMPSDFFTADNTISGTGSSIALANTAESVIKNITINGDATQDGTPTPDSPVDIDIVTGEQTVAITGAGTQTYIIDLGDMELCAIGDAKDYIFKSGSKWYKHASIGKANLKTDATDWNRQSTGTSGNYRFCVKVSQTDVPFLTNSSATPTSIICNYFRAGSRGNTHGKQEKIALAESSSSTTYLTFNMYIDSLKADTVDGFKTWLQNNEVIVYYESTAPSDIEITDFALIAQLNALASASTYLGTTTVAVSGDLPTPLSIEAFKNGWSGTVSGINNEIVRIKTDKADTSILANYYDKDEAETAIKERLAENVSFLFNPQKSVNGDCYAPTSDTTPAPDTTYYVQTGQDINDNGYEPCTRLTEFKSGVTYYERTSSYMELSGECSIIKAFGKTIMIDTGGQNRSEPIKEFLQDNNVTKVDYLIISHYHYDHCTNLGYLKNYIDFTTCKCYLPLEAPVSASVDGQDTSTLMAAINELGLEYVYPNELDTLEVGDLKITFYNCGSEAFNEINTLFGESTRKVNDYSMLCLVNYLNTNILYSGDIESTAQQRLYNRGFFEDITIDLYKWHHHGVNALDDLYMPYLGVIKPKQVVVVSGEVGRHAKFDTRLLDTYDVSYAWDTTLEWESNGSVIKKSKENKPTFSYKNINLFGNNFALNSYLGFLKITNVWYFRTCSLLLRIVDTQNGKSQCIAEISYHLENHTQHIQDVKIENISSKGDFNIVKDLRVATVGNTVYLFLKKSQNNITPTVTLLDVTAQQPFTKIEPIYIEMTSAEFESRYGDSNYSYTDLNDLTLESPFANSTGSRTTWKKKNGVVEILGSLTTTEQINAGAEVIIAKLPKEISPAGAIHEFQQSNQFKRWTALISYDSSLGCYTLKFTRFGVDDFIACPQNAWLPIHITYLAD